MGIPDTLEGTIALNVLFVFCKDQLYIYPPNYSSSRM